MGRFARAYIEAALWSSTGDDGEPLDKTHGVDDIAPKTLAKMHADCEAFMARAGHLLGGEWEQGGHDFWLTRARHGAGFWDGDWPDNVAPDLTIYANAFPEVDLYVGDDGLVYQMGAE
jgi:hypothetical protein